jgi:hypothetical protein
VLFRSFHPSARSDEDLWADCAPTTVLLNEQPADVPVRVALAADELRRRYNARRSVVTAMLGHDYGQTPRPFVSAAAEDALGLQDGHIVARHVLGPHRTMLDLARRILEPGPQHMTRSSAFNNVAQANTGIAAWLTNTVQGANWPAFREVLLTTGAYQESLPVPGAAGLGVSLRRAPGVAVPIMNPNDLPRSLVPTGVNRPAYPGDPVGAGAPMTDFEPCNRVTVRILADQGAPGGWFVHSAWPSR